MKTVSNNWTAEAFLFSGRPNPQWPLTEEQATDWMKLWEAATPSVKEARQLAILGYTGCKLHHDKHSYWLMADGCVSFFDQDTVINRSDPGRKMEYFLLHTAPEEVKQVLRVVKVL
jgi:hypothetical protein